MREDRLELALWDMATLQRKRVLTERGKVNGWDVSPDDRWIATAGDEWAARLWDPSTGRKGYLLADPEAREPEFAVAFSPDGRLLAAGGKQGVLRVWKVPPR
jgi:WD40 repeat protein